MSTTKTAPRKAPKASSRKGKTRSKKATVTNLDDKRKVKTAETKPATAETQPAKPETKPKAANAVELGKAVSFKVSPADLKPLLAVAPTKEVRHYLNGIYVHKVGNELRLVATDGHRMLVVSREHNAELSWAEEGLLIPSDQLTRIMKYIGASEEPIDIAFGKHWATVTLKTAGATFTVNPIDAPFPDYGRLLEDAGKVFTAERELLETSAVAPKYLKSAGQIATLLDATAVYCYLGDGKSQMVFTFAGAPGVMLIQMVMQSDRPGLDGSVARIIGQKGLAGTLAALKAHETRNRKAAKEASDATERERCEGAAERFASRINEIMSGLKPKLENRTIN